MFEHHQPLVQVIANPFELHLDEFLQSLDIRDSSKNTYRRQLKEFFSWIKNSTTSSPDRGTILLYKNYLITEKELSALTIGGYLTALRRFFEWLEAMRIYPNIAKAVRGPKKRRGFKKDALSVEQAKQLLFSIDRADLTGKRDFALINLMIRTGLRTIEIARARIEDIARYAGEQVLWIHGKGRDGKDEFVLLTCNALNPINEYLQARSALKPRASLFASHSSKNFGRMLTTRSISRIIKNRLIAIGIDESRITAHSLRHTAVTFSLLAGATPQEARALARHSDINTTLLYAHNINRIQHAPERKIDQFLD